MSCLLRRLTNLIKNKKTEVIGYLLLVICILGLMIRTIVRNMDWKNEDSLWISMARISYSDPKTHNNLGDMYGRRGNLKKAEEEFKIAIRLNPNYGDAYHNLGNAYMQMGKTDLALKSYQKAASINPNLWQSYQNISIIYFNQKNFQEAEKYMLQAIKINPADSNLYTNIAVIYIQMRDLNRATQSLSKALELDPTNTRAKEFLVALRTNNPAKNSK